MKLWPFGGSREPTVRVEPTLDAQNASPENPSTSLANPADWLVTALGGGPSIAGPVVNEYSAIRSTVVYRCVSLLAGLIASMPLNVCQDGKDGRRVVTGNRVANLLLRAPSDLMTAFTWKELIAVNLLLSGDHFSVIEYDGAGRVVGFLPVAPQQTTVRRTASGRLRYSISFTDGGVEEFDQDDVLHIPGLGFDGLRGVSPIGMVGKQSIGLGLAMEESTARLHANGARPSGTVTGVDGLSKNPDSFRRLRAQFDDAYSGLRNNGKTIFLDKGMEWKAMQISPQDAQTMDMRRFQVADICRIFGVPPHLVFETDKTTSWGSGIEQMTIGFLMFALNPWLTRVEAELNRKLFPNSNLFAWFDRDSLLAMDAAAQSALFSSGIQNGWLKPSEVRRARHLPDEAGADQLFINTSLTPITKAGQNSVKAPPKPPEPASNPAQPPDDQPGADQ